MSKSSNRKRRRQAVRPRGPTSGSLNGSELRTKPDIPSLRLTPWYQATVLLGSTGDTIATVNAIWTALAAQQNLGTYDSSSIFSPITGYMRITKIRVWNVSGGLVKLTVYNILDNATTSSGGVQKSLVDYPGRNHYAKVGYLWPQSQRTISSDTAQTNPVFTVDLSDTTESWIGYVDVMWRGISETAGSAPTRSTNLRDLPRIQMV